MYKRQVITSNVSSLPEVVGEAGLMVSPEDADGLSEKIIELTEDDALVTHLSQESVKRAATFTWERCAEQTVSVYRQI